jgi:hypothetical protein
MNANARRDFLKRVGIGALTAGLGWSLAGLLQAAQESPDRLLDRYRKLDFAATRTGPLNQTDKEKLALEGALIRAGKLEPFRAALKDSLPPVRAFAARALGILGDKESADALSVLVKGDPDGIVREGALQSLSWLKAGADAIQAAKSDRDSFVRFAAGAAEAQRTDPVDYAAKIRAEYDVPLTLESMDRARVGQIAPDFSAVDTEGNPFQLSKVVGKSIVVLDFLIADY